MASLQDINRAKALVEKAEDIKEVDGKWKFPYESYSDEDYEKYKDAVKLLKKYNQYDSPEQGDIA